MQVAHAQETTDAREAKRAARAAWAAGDYHRFARELMWERGAEMVRECGVRPGDRLLDVAAGSGNVAIQAARAGARATASDLVSRHFEAGQREAAAAGVSIDWIEADAEALPFPDGSFDVVCSTFGVMFAPDHRRAASELLRVCRRGGTIGVASFTPDGLGGDFFGVLAPYLPPPPPGASSPLEWGDEGHVRDLLGQRAEIVRLERRTYAEHASDPDAYRRLFEEAFGPVVTVRDALAGDPGRLAAFDRELAAYARRHAEPSRAGGVSYSYEYLLAIARRR